MAYDLVHYGDPSRPELVFQNTNGTLTAAWRSRVVCWSSFPMVEAFLAAVRSNEDLQRQLRGATTAADLVAAAAQAGLTIEPAALVKGFAQLLLESDDAMAVRNFDNLGWDMGELLWAAKTWERPDQA